MISEEKDLKWLRFCAEGAKIFSTCAKMQYMAIIVNANGVIDATGYNGAPAGFEHCIDGGCPRYVNQVPSGTAYDSGPGLCYAIHAEINCLIHSDASKRQGGTLYVNGVPCFGCAKTVANSGVSRLVYLGEAFEREGASDVYNLFEKATNLEVISIPSLEPTPVISTIGPIKLPPRYVGTDNL